MLAYFPQIYPGELLYSVLARYHRHLGSTSPIHSMEALFGRRLIVASIDLPGYLQVLADRLPEGFGWTVDRLIDELTLLPYYTAFQPEAVAKRARAALKCGDTDGLLLRLGMAAFSVGRVTRLRFCLDCLGEMKALYGELYWRRDHQLSGVLVCPDHGRLLQVSNVSVTAESRHVYAPADRDSCPWNAPVLVATKHAAELNALRRLAISSRALLEYPDSRKSFKQWTQHYRRELFAAGLATSAKRTDQARFQAAFGAHHREVLGLMPGLVEPQPQQTPWLMAMVRSHRKAFHPLQHVLLQNFLDHQVQIELPFGKGPWLCMNPLAKHCHQPVILSMQLHRNHGHSVGVFVCRCGYVYTRSFFASSGAVGPPRFQTYGPMLKPALRDMIEARQSLRMIAHRLKLDPKTVIKLARELEIATSWKLKGGQARRTSTKSVLPVMPSRKQQLSSKSRPLMKCPRLDWKQIDQRTCHQLRQAAQHLREQTPPVRISLLRIERHLWNRGWLSKRTGKLPETMKCVQQLVESVAQFQQRRTRWIIREMDRIDEPLLVWRILRKVGLKESHRAMVEALLVEYFEVAWRQAA